MQFSMAYGCCFVVVVVCFCLYVFVYLCFCLGVCVAYVLCFAVTQSIAWRSLSVGLLFLSTGALGYW